jgi:heme/copper-type cytochrome/quinol oxidase subunit 3
MSGRRTIDVSELPTFVFGHRALTWWATWSLILIEGTMFVVLFVAYFFLRTRVADWPPGATSPPGLLYGTLNTVLFLASVVPNMLTLRAAERIDVRGVRLWLGVTIGFAVAISVVRVFEFGALNVGWDTNAYGSIVWVNMGLHTAHLLTDLFDSIILLALMIVGPVEGKRFTDVSENSIYWNFVVVMWLPMYAVVYLAPRLI